MSRSSMPVTSDAVIVTFVEGSPDFDPNASILKVYSFASASQIVRNCDSHWDS